MIRVIVSVIKWLWRHVVLLWYCVLLGFSTWFVIDNFQDITSFKSFAIYLVTAAIVSFFVPMYERII